MCHSSRRTATNARVHGVSSRECVKPTSQARAVAVTSGSFPRAHKLEAGPSACIPESVTMPQNYIARDAILAVTSAAGASAHYTC